MLDSLVRVSRRVAYDHYASVRAEARSSVRAGRIAPPAIRGRRRATHFPGTFDLPPKPTLARPRGSAPARMPEASAGPRVWSQALPFQQFHMLFNSLFKVLFIFRSLYLCAIGLRPIFSFRWNLPPIWSCIPKQLDSSKELHTGPATRSQTGFSPSMTPRSRGLRPGPDPKHPLQITTRAPKGVRFQI